MGIRFRKSIRIAPGVKLNLNKKSVGLTVGTKGASVTLNSKGRMTASIGVPGTGLPAFKKVSKFGVLKSRHSGKALKRVSVIFYILGALLAVMALLLIMEEPAAGILFLAFAGLSIFMGRQYSKAALDNREETESSQRE